MHSSVPCSEEKSIKFKGKGVVNKKGCSTLKGRTDEDCAKKCHWQKKEFDL